MANYELLRKDFTTEIERCHFCRRRLISKYLVQGNPKRYRYR